MKVRDAVHDAYEADPTPDNLVASQDDAKVPVRPALKRRTELVGHEKAQEIFSTIDAGSEAARKPTQKVAAKDTPPPEAAPATAQAAAAQVNTEPTDGQKDAGNYQKGHFAWNGLGLTLENPKGSERSGVSPDGKAWSVSMPAHYGYFKRNEGADGDHVDFYMGDHENSDTVLMVDQIDPKTKAFDEHKIVIGAKDGRQARSIYVAGFSDGSGAQRIGAATRITVAQLKDWLANGDTSKPYSDKMAGQQEVASPALQRPKRLIVKQVNVERAAKLQAYFMPGAVVQGYGGAFDRVIAFDPGKDGVECDKSPKAVSLGVASQRAESGLMVVRHGKCGHAVKLSFDHRHACPDWTDMEGDSRFCAVSPLRLMGLGPPPKLAEADGRWSIQSNSFPKTARKYQ